MIVIHPLIFKAFNSYFEVNDTMKTEVYLECCSLILDAHKGTVDPRKKGGDSTDKANVEPINANKHLLGRDPHVKSLVKSVPPRILLSEDGIKQTHKLQVRDRIERE